MKQTINALSVVATLAVMTLVLAPTAASAQGTLFVEGNNVGIGLSAPNAPLHMQGTGQTTMFQVDNPGPARITFNNTSAPSQWSFGQENNDRFVVNRAGSGIQEFAVATNGDILVGASVVHTSSRASKEGFLSVDPGTVLTKLVNLPITTWSYKADNGAVRHIGPVAEEFYAAFSVGRDDKTIALNDSIGVAFAAIQGLNEVLERKSADLEEAQRLLSERDLELEQIRNRLERLEASLPGAELKE